ncbi:MAG: hypothetical protein E7099_06020 [Mediterranea massiliensis]|nr:hypothetical protein [Mediterranea massiliensis]
MKKFFYSVFALATMLLATTSCSQEMDEASAPIMTGVTSFSVQLTGSLQTRTAGDGESVDKLYYAVYQDGTKVYPSSGNGTSSIANDLTAKVEIPLLKGETYDIIFWAQKDDNGIYDITDLTNIKVNYNATLSNQEKYDAFYNALNDFKADNKAHTVELRRPFAQLNLGTGDWEKAKSALKDTQTDPVTHSQVKVYGLANTFAPLTGVASGSVEATFTAAAITKESFNVTVDGEEKGYTNLALNYLLVPCTKAPQGLGNHEAIPTNEKALVDIEFVLYRGENNVLFAMDKISNAPVQRNYRTNVIGDLLTSTGFDIIIKPEEDKPATDLIAIAEGLVKDNTTGVYYISSANGLSYASQYLFAQGGSFVLTDDVDMEGATSVVTKAEGLVWNSQKLTHTMANRSFEFDGDNHTIKNLPGMFIAYTGSAKSVLVKNLTLETPNVAFNVEDNPKTDGVGAFIGYAGTSESITLDNCHVKGGKIEGGHWTGGLVGYAAGYSGNDGPVFETLTIKNSSVKNATITGKGSCGGIIGHATGDAWTLVDMDNITVTSNTINSTGSDTNKAGSVMGTVGNAGKPTEVNGVTKTGGITIDTYEVSGNRVESNKVANTKLWGRQGNSDGVLTLDGEKVEDFGSYTEPASEFTYENGVYTLQKITATALTEILADAEENTYGDITIELADDQALSWAAGPAGDGANKLAHDGKVTIKNGTLSVTGAGSFVVENELELDGVTVVDNTAYYSENGETAWEFCYLELTAKGTYKNCVFENTIMVDGQSATFENCKFLGKSTNEANKDNEYSVWVYNGTANFEKCEFTGARGMKVCDMYTGSDVTSVEIDECTFTDLYKKPGLAIDNRIGELTVVIKNSTFTDVQPGEQGLYIYETDNVVPSIYNSKVIVDGVELFGFDADGNKVVTVTNDAELKDAIENAAGATLINLATGTYSNDIKLTVEELGGAKGDLIFKAAEGAEPVIAGTVTLGYRNQGVGAAMWNGNVTFEGITFDHANDATHSIDVHDVKSLTLMKCKIIGDGEYGIGSARGNATGTSKIEGCTFENAGMQLLGNFATGLVIDDCDFTQSCINVQAGNSVTIQGCRFDNKLTSANLSPESFYLIRSNSTPITVKGCTINIDSELTDVATEQAKWGILWNRGTTNWTVENVAVTMSEAALKQTELLVTKCASTGVINTKNLTVNGKAYASTAAQLTSAVGAGATEIYVQGKFNMPSNGTSNAITISSLNGNATIDNTLGSYWDNATLTFNNVNFKTGTGKAGGPNGSDYAAFYSKNVTYNNCNFSGPMRLGRDGAKFVECTFNDLGNDYVWTYGNAATFQGCTFNSEGKALLIYSDGGNGSPAVSVIGCKFNATTGAKAGAISNQNCAAIEIHNYGYGVTLTTSDNTIEKDGDKFSGEWRIKTYETRNADSKIFVNGTEYTTLALDGKKMTISGTEVTVVE